MDASPYTAIVGAGRRLATELVVMRASAIHEIQTGLGILADRDDVALGPRPGIFVSLMAGS
jgi:hypothetical protein